MECPVTNDGGRRRAFREGQWRVICGGSNREIRSRAGGGAKGEKICTCVRSAVMYVCPYVISEEEGIDGGKDKTPPTLWGSGMPIPPLLLHWGIEMGLSILN